MDEKQMLALTGVCGVVVGALLASLKDYFFVRRTDLRDAGYLAALVVPRLEGFAQEVERLWSEDCWLSQRAQINFTVEDLDVEWKSLPSTLAFRIRSFSKQIAESDALARRNFPSDEVNRGLWHFYTGYAIQAMALAGELRRFSGLPRHQKHALVRYESMYEINLKALESYSDRQRTRAFARTGALSEQPDQTEE